MKKLMDFAGDLLGPLGIQLGNWMSGSKGDAHTLSGLNKARKDMFGGAFDANKLQSSYQEELRRKMPDSVPYVQVIDRDTLISYLGKQLEASDASKIKKAEYSLCTRMDKKDKSYKLYNRKLIADVLMSSIEGFFKKHKLTKLGLPRFTKNDVVFVNNYSENKRSKSDVKYNVDKSDGAVPESKTASEGHLLLEAVDVNERLEKMRDELRKTAKSILKDRLVQTDIDTASDVVSRLKAEAAVDAKTLYNLQKYKYVYVIKTEVEKEEGSKDLETLAADVQKVFSEVIYSVAKEYGDGRSPSEKAVQALKPMSTLTESKSSKDLNEFMSLLFEDLVVEAMSEDEVIKSIDKQLRSAFTDTIKS